MNIVKEIFYLYVKYINFIFQFIFFVFSSFLRRLVGYLSMKVGKVVATVVGGSLVVMQLAAHQGYIKVGCEINF